MKKKVLVCLHKNKLDIDGYGVTIPGLDCATQGDSREDAIVMAKDIIEMNLKCMSKEDRDYFIADEVETAVVEVEI